MYREQCFFMGTVMGNCEKFIANIPVNSAEFFTAITYASSELYISMHVLDLEDMTAFPIKSNEFIDKFMKNADTLQESVTNIMVNLACPESVETIKNFTILSTLPGRLKNTNVVSEIFHGKIHGWSKAIFVRIGDEIPLRRVLYLVENVNAQMTKLEQEKELLEQHRKQLLEMNDKVYTDSLTQVMNRKYFDEKLVSRNSQAVVMADIDFFKEVNDNYGHQCGDAALAAVASILSSSVRGLDRVVRYGGDEFLISFKGISHEVLRNRLEQIRTMAENIRLQDYPNVRLTMSLGGTFGDGTVSDMLSFADKALYESKKKRNCVTLVPFQEKI
jgi:diguanylate cyclase (GGDEF)-like protein